MKNIEISIQKIIEKIIEKFAFILIISLLSGLVCFALSRYVIKPIYESNTTMIINNFSNKDGKETQSNIEIGQIQANKALISTYSEIVKSKGIADSVINNLSLDMDYEEFSEKVSIESVKDTQIISVKVVDTIPDRAKDIANETANIFKNSIGDIMKVDNVQILDGATSAEKPISPNITFNTLIGILLGLVLGSLIVVVNEITDKSIKDSDQVSEYFDIPVIGILPDKK